MEALTRTFNHATVKTWESGMAKTRVRFEKKLESPPPWTQKRRSTPPPPGTEIFKKFPPKGGIFIFFVFWTFYGTHFFGKILTSILFLFLKSLFIAFFLNNFFQNSENFLKRRLWCRNPFFRELRARKRRSNPLPTRKKEAEPPWRQNGRIKGDGRGVGHPWWEWKINGESLLTALIMYQHLSVKCKGQNLNI